MVVHIHHVIIAALCLSGCAASSSIGGASTVSGEEGQDAVFWIDTDLGFAADDFMALVIAGRRLGSRLKGVSTTLYRPDEKARMSRLILDELALCHVPVYAGEGVFERDAESFRRRYPRWPPRFGPSPRQGQALAAVFGRSRVASKRFGEQGAAALTSAVHQHAGKIVVVVLGPMTNLAKALRKDPSIARKIRQVVVMGGWYLKPDGRSVKRPSYNTLMDLEAARQVFSRRDLRLMVVNSQTLEDAGMTLTAREQRRMQSTRPGTPLARALLRDMRSWSETIGAHRGGRLALADPVTVAVALRPQSARSTSPVRIRLIDLPGVHMMHERVGELIRFSLGDRTFDRVRVVTRFRDPGRLRQEIVSELEAFMRAAPGVRCRRVANR